MEKPYLFFYYWIYLIFVMFDFDVHPCILPVYLGVSLFLISMNLYYLSKKKNAILPN